MRDPSATPVVGALIGAFYLVTGAWALLGRSNLPALVHVRSVVDGRLPVRLPGHQHEPRSRLRLLNGQHTARSKNRNLTPPRATSVGAEAGFALQHMDEPVEAGLDGEVHYSALWQLDVKDEARSPEPDTRAP